VGCDNRGVVAASLHTGRLDLAVPAAGDAEAIFTILGDPATVAHNPADFLADVAEAHEMESRKGSGVSQPERGTAGVVPDRGIQQPL
jgi:hypothetical protein